MVHQKGIEMAEWKDINFDDCPECGGSIQVFTDAVDGYCYDGDPARCMDCGFKSGMSVDESGNAWVQDA